MMLCHGGVISLKSPPRTRGKGDVKKFFTDVEAGLSHCRQASRSQVFEQRSDQIRTKSVDAKFSSFKNSPLGGVDEGKLRKTETTTANNCTNLQDVICKKKSKTLLKNASCKQDGFLPSGIKSFSEIPASDAQDHSGEDWRSLSRALASGAKVSAISNHELMRIAELRFSTDMNEGDSGNQVLLLQKALFWLGHLSKQSDITGYFGTETKQALRKFQDAHGVSQTGLWGPLSKQALWHTVSAEILHRAVGEKSSSGAQKENTTAEPDIFKQMFQSCSTVSLADVFMTMPPKGDWRFRSGIAFLMVGVLLGLLISRVSFLPLHNKLMKRKIVRSMESEKHTFISRDKKLDAKPSLSGATSVKSMSELTSRNPLYTSDVGASNQMDDLGSSYISSMGHDVQNGAPMSQGVSRRHAFSLPLPTPKVSSSKVRADSGRGKQPGQLMRSLRQAGSVSRMRMKGDSSSSSSGVQETPRLHKEGKDSSIPPSILRHPLAGQKDEFTGTSKRIENDFQHTKDDGAALGGVQGEEEPNVRKHIEELRKAIEAAEKNGQVAVLALADERKRSLELEDKISRQRESAAALEEEVRVLKESHDALLESLRKKTGPTTRGASLLYRDFKNDGRNGFS